MLKKIISSLVLISIPAVIFCQQKSPEVTMPSPTAASLGLYGEVPVSPFTGLANVAAPLHTIQEGSVKVPVSLSYHGSGVRADQRPGWVGLNWSLNAGGVITRVTHDLPDEYNCANNTLKTYHYSLPEFFAAMNQFSSTIKGNKAGYYYRRDYLQASDWNQPSRIADMAEQKADAQDTEPDEFNFNFLDYSGKFFLDENGTWQVKSDQNIRVVFETDHFIDLPATLLVTSEKHNQAWCSRVSDNLKSFGGFTLITDDGTQYVFGCTSGNISTDAIEYSIPFFQQMFNQWIATSWYLTKIISPDGHTVTLTYEPDDYISNMYLYFLWKREVFLKNNTTAACDLYGQQQAFGDDNEWTAGWISPRYAPYLGNLIRPAYLKEITTPNVKIVFKRSTSNDLNYNKGIYAKNRILARDIRATGIAGAGSTPYSQCRSQDNSPEKDIDWPFLYDVIQSNDHEALLGALRWKKLDAVEIVNRNAPDKGFKYTLTYNNTPAERLMLLNVAKQSLDNTIFIPKYYSFEYYDHPGITLPAYLEEGADHWGFANGNTIKSFTLPRSWQFTQDGPPRIDLREPTGNLDIAIEGSLKKITYPTGGSSLFTYEKHRYSKMFEITTCDGTIPNCLINSSNQLAGGLRIKKITNKSEEADPKPVVKEYLYLTGYTPSVTDINALPSSGILGGRSQCLWQQYNMKVKDENVKKVHRTIISSQSVLPLSVNSHGTHIGYSEVVERQSDGAYTIFKFTNFDNGHFDEKPDPGSYNDLSPHTVVVDRSQERGKQLEQSSYNSSGKLVYQNISEYTIYSGKFARTLNLTANTFLCESGVFVSYLGLPYKLYYNKFLKTKDEVTHFDPSAGTPVKTTTRYNYAAFKFSNAESYMLKQVETVNSDNIAYKTVYKYPPDYPKFSDAPSYAPDAVTATMTAMGDLHRLNYPVEILKYRDNKVTDATVQTYIGAALPFETYQMENTESMFDFLYPAPRYANDHGNVINFKLYQPFDKARLIYDRYGDKGTILQYHTSDGVYTSFIWGYNSAHPVAKIENATYDEVVSVLGQSLVNELNTLTWTDEEIRSKIQTLRQHTSLQKARVTTYTYDPLKGLTSVTDVNGRTSFYQYDALNRLRTIRDHDGNIIKNYTYNLKN